VKVRVIRMGLMGRMGGMGLMGRMGHRRVLRRPVRRRRLVLRRVLHWWMSRVLAAANQETDTEPTEAQKEAGAAAQGAGSGRRLAD